MPTIIEEKTKELCNALIAETAPIRKNIDTFLANADAKNQYEAVMSKGQALQEKQHGGETLTSTEIADFEKHRDELLKNSVARSFLDAQEELHELQHVIQKQIKKTLELGRIPTESDLEESCGHGCGCHGH